MSAARASFSLLTRINANFIGQIPVLFQDRLQAGHAGLVNVWIIRFPGCFQGFISHPVVFAAIKELLPVAFILVNTVDRVTI